MGTCSKSIGSETRRFKSILLWVTQHQQALQLLGAHGAEAPTRHMELILRITWVLMHITWVLLHIIWVLLRIIWVLLRIRHILLIARKLLILLMKKHLLHQTGHRLLELLAIKRIIS